MKKNKIIVALLLCIFSLSSINIPVFAENLEVVYFNADSSEIYVGFNFAIYGQSYDGMVGLKHYGDIVPITVTVDENDHTMMKIKAIGGIKKGDLYELNIKAGVGISGNTLSDNWKQYFVVKQLRYDDFNGTPNATAVPTGWFKPAGGQSSIWSADGKSVFLKDNAPQVAGLGDWTNYTIEYEAIYGGGTDYINVRNSNRNGFNQGGLKAISFQPSYGQIGPDTYAKDANGVDIPNKYYEFKYLSTTKATWSYKSRLTSAAATTIDTKTSNIFYGIPSSGQRYKAKLQAKDNQFILSLNDKICQEIQHSDLTYGAPTINTYGSLTASNYVDWIDITTCELYKPYQSSPEIGQEKVKTDTNIVISNLDYMINRADFIQNYKNYIIIKVNGENFENFTADLNNNTNGMTITFLEPLKKNCTYILKFSKNMQFINAPTGYYLGDLFFKTEPNDFDLSCKLYNGSEEIKSLDQLQGNELSVKCVCTNFNVTDGIEGVIAISVFDESNHMIGNQMNNLSLSLGEIYAFDAEFPVAPGNKYRVRCMVFDSVEKLNLISHIEYSQIDKENADSVMSNSIMITDSVNSVLTIQGIDQAKKFIPVIIKFNDGLLHMDLIPVDVNGRYKSNVTLNLPLDFEGGYLDVYLSGVKQDEIYYAPLSVVLDKAKKVCGLYDEESPYTYEELALNLQENKDVMSINTSLFQKTDTKKLAKLILGKLAQISFSVNENEALNKLKDLIAKYNVLSAFNEGKRELLFNSEQQFLYTEIYDLIGSIKDVTSLGDLYKTNIKYEGIVNVIDSLMYGEYNDFDDLSKELARQVIVNGIKHNKLDGYGYISNYLTTQNVTYAGYSVPKYLSVTNKNQINEEIWKIRSTITSDNLAEKVEQSAQLVIDKNSGIIGEKKTSPRGGGAAPHITVPDPVVTNSVEQIEFTDLDDTPWAKEAINNLASLKIIEGVGDKLFSPKSYLTREQAVKILLIAFRIEPAQNIVSFSDVEPSSWYAPYAETAKELKIVSGIDEKNFGVGMNITRQDFATMIYRILNPTDSVEVEGFFDDIEINNYAKKAVYYLKQQNVLSGYEDGAFRPQQNINRAEAVQIINILIQKKLSSHN